MVAIMLKFLQNIMVILINVIYLIPSIRYGFETISEELQFNIIVLKDMIEVRVEGKLVKA